MVKADSFIKIEESIREILFKVKEVEKDVFWQKETFLYIMVNGLKIKDME